MCRKQAGQGQEDTDEEEEERVDFVGGLEVWELIKLMRLHESERSMRMRQMDRQTDRWPGGQTDRKGDR